MHRATQSSVNPDSSGTGPLETDVEIKLNKVSFFQINEMELKGKNRLSVWGSLEIYPRRIFLVSAAREQKHAWETQAACFHISIAPELIWWLPSGRSCNGCESIKNNLFLRLLSLKWKMKESREINSAAFVPLVNFTVSELSAARLPRHAGCLSGRPAAQWPSGTQRVRCCSDSARKPLHLCSPLESLCRGFKHICSPFESL